MLTEQIESFVFSLISMTKKGLLAWESFPQHYPFHDNFFIQNFIERTPTLDKTHSYFFSHKNGLVLFIHYTPSNTNELYIQTHFGEPAINLTDKCSKFSLSLLESAIHRFNESTKSLPDSICKFMSDIEKLNNSFEQSQDCNSGTNDSREHRISSSSSNSSVSILLERKKIDKDHFSNRNEVFRKALLNKTRTSNSDPNSSLNNTLEELSVGSRRPHKFRKVDTGEDDYTIKKDSKAEDLKQLFNFNTNK